jgi:hypothetical protein
MEYNRNLTGVRDVDLLILQKLDDRSLFAFCQTDQYAKRLCQNENFWEKRFLERYGPARKRKDRTWRNFYLNISKYYIEVQPNINDDNEADKILLDPEIGAYWGDDENGRANVYIQSMINMEKDGLDAKEDWDLFDFFENQAINFIKHTMLQHLTLGSQVGRDEEGKEEFDEYQMKDFVARHKKEINKAAKKMYNSYKKKGTLTKLINPQGYYHTKFLEKLQDKIVAE